MKAILKIDMPATCGLCPLMKVNEGVAYCGAMGKEVLIMDLPDWCPLEAEPVHSGYQCFHCLSDSVIWQNDFSFEDYCMEGEGIVHVCHCANCGADIEYYVRLDNEEQDD